MASETSERNTDPASAPPARKSFRKGLILVAGVIVLSSAWPAWDYWEALPEGIEAEYVGRQSCVECHQDQVGSWEGSDHDLAMDRATPEFVLGDFDGTQLEHHGVTSRMSRRGDGFFVETEGPDGRIADFKVDYVYGVRPLQQYLTELEGGRVQVLPVSWATEEKRWFYASPDEPFGPQDPLHWTGSAQNWNHMCADCHSTNYARNYDVEQDEYHYSFSEIDVSCEACHGPGSLHIELAKSNSIFWDRRYGYGLPNLKAESSQTELEACAPCHSRRRRLAKGFQPGDDYSDYYGLSLLEEGLYHADGQIDDEAYVYGSFLQSLMYRKGVRCTDCHDPHTARVKFEGNRLCTQCHEPAKYDGISHHHHQPGTRGSLCVECHMPDRKYMVVDPRRDHSLRVPRPDLTVSIGTPNACNDCHTKPEETARWAADRIVEWYGPERRNDPHFGEIIAAGREGKPDARHSLARLTGSPKVGPIVRATAASLLATRYSIDDTQSDIERALRRREAMVRAAAIQTFDRWPIQSRQDAETVRELLVPMFRDRSRLVRTEAGRVAVGFPQELFAPDERDAMLEAVEEYRQSLLLNADLSGAQLSLGILYSSLGDTQKAEQAYRIAIRLDPAVAGPRSNLAQLLEARGKKEEVRKLRIKEAELLERDAGLVPDHAMLWYRLGLLRYVLGREETAGEALRKAVELEPESVDFRMALTLFYEKYERWSEALRSARALRRMAPENPSVEQVYQKIKAGAEQSRARGPQPAAPGPARR